MALAKLASTARVGDRVFEAIHDAIMSGELPAGHRLQIRPIAADLGTSVMPVREAITRLHEIGLVESAPYRGAAVKRFTSRELLDSYAVRRLLEVEAARLGAPAATNDDLAALETLRDRMAAALDEERAAEYLDADEAFLTTLYAAADNPVLLDAVTGLWRRCRTYKILGVRQELAEGRLAPLLAHQNRLVEAARARDGHRAAEITAASLDAAIARIEHAPALRTPRHHLGAS